jgi:hypothetical protein
LRLLTLRCRRLLRLGGYALGRLVLRCLALGLGRSRLCLLGLLGLARRLWDRHSLGELRRLLFGPSLLPYTRI